MTSYFMKVKCTECGNEQIVFSHPAMDVKCLKCNAILLQPRGGKGHLLHAEVVETYE